MLFRRRSINVNYVSIVKEFCFNWFLLPTVILSFPTLLLPYKFLIVKFNHINVCVLPLVMHKPTLYSAQNLTIKYNVLYIFVLVLSKWIMHGNFTFYSRLLIITVKCFETLLGNGKVFFYIHLAKPVCILLLVTIITINFFSFDLKSISFQAKWLFVFFVLLLLIFISPMIRWSERSKQSSSFCHISSYEWSTSVISPNTFLCERNSTRYNYLRKSAYFSRKLSTLFWLRSDTQR